MPPKRRSTSPTAGCFVAETKMKHLLDMLEVHVPDVDVGPCDKCNIWEFIDKGHVDRTKNRFVCRWCSAKE
jgi:hypothetical protein